MLMLSTSGCRRPGRTHYHLRPVLTVVPGTDVRVRLHEQDSSITASDLLNELIIRSDVLK